MSDATQILQRASAGSSRPPEELFLIVYERLRRLAAWKMSGEKPGHTLQPTALVHEVWLRLSAELDSRWKNEEQFYSVAAEVMRRILIDRARRRSSRKHGGELQQVEIDSVDFPVAVEDETLLEVNDALDRLALIDPEKAEVVKLRFFIGLENEEIATLMGVSEKTVRRHWSFARAWLFRTMRKNKCPVGS